jgi:hypothetical protein
MATPQQLARQRQWLGYGPSEVYEYFKPAGGDAEKLNPVARADWYQTEGMRRDRTGLQQEWNADDAANEILRQSVNQPSMGLLRMIEQTPEVLKSKQFPNLMQMAETKTVLEKPSPMSAQVLGPQLLAKLKHPVARQNFQTNLAQGMNPNQAFDLSLGDEFNFEREAQLGAAGIPRSEWKNMLRPDASIYDDAAVAEAIARRKASVDSKPAERVRLLTSTMNDVEKKWEESMIPPEERDPGEVEFYNQMRDERINLMRQVMGQQMPAAAAVAATGPDGSPADTTASFGYPVEEPSGEVLEYLKQNPNVAGMAWGGGENGTDPKSPRSIIVNPFNKFMADPTKREGLIAVEAARHKMSETGYNPTFQITPEQQKWRKGLGAYATDDKAFRQSIISRLMVGDGVPGATAEQKAEAEKMWKTLKGEKEEKPSIRTLDDIVPPEERKAKQQVDAAVSAEKQQIDRAWTDAKAALAAKIQEVYQGEDFVDALGAVLKGAKAPNREGLPTDDFGTQAREDYATYLLRNAGIVPADVAFVEPADQRGGSNKVRNLELLKALAEDVVNAAGIQIKKPKTEEPAETAKISPEAQAIIDEIKKGKL